MSIKQEYVDNLTNVVIGGNNMSYFNGTGSNLTSVPETTPWISAITWELELLFWMLFVPIILSGIILNIMVICIILYYKKMRRNSANYSILNLAVADLVMSVCNTPWNFVYMLYNKWKWGELFCRMNQFLSNTSIAASVLTLLATCAERHWVMCYMNHPKPSRRTMTMIMLGIWVVSFGISSPNLYYYKLHPELHSTSYEYICKWDADYQHFEFVYDSLFPFITYFVPMFSMAYCYFRICQNLRDTRDIGQGDAAQRKLHERNRMIEMFMWVVFYFAICWLPFHVYFLVHGIWPSVKDYEPSQVIFLFIYWVAMLNSTMNPYIYYRFIPIFKERFKQIIGCKFLRRPRAEGINKLDSYDNSRTLTTSRKDELSNGMTMDTFVSVSQKHSFHALAEEAVDALTNETVDALADNTVVALADNTVVALADKAVYAQQSCETDA